VGLPRLVPAVRSSLLLTVVVGLLGALLVVASPARAAGPVEDYAPYQPQTRCSPKAKKGTVVLASWVVRKYGGRSGGISRGCRVGGQSEHKEGRAFDWMVTVRKKADRKRVKRFLKDIFATDAAGNRDAKARRMGIMYVIWDDRIWSAYGGFRARRYKHYGCKKVSRCSATLRHRDHVHISITRHAAKGRYSWYAGRL
jgi:hypothetical protein